MLPETIIRNALINASIPAFTVIDDPNNYDEFVLIVRTSNYRETFDTNRNFVNKTYNFLLQCFSVDGLKEAAELQEKVADIIGDLYFDSNVSELIISGGTILPEMNSKFGYSVGLTISLL